MKFFILIIFFSQFTLASTCKSAAEGTIKNRGGVLRFCDPTGWVSLGDGVTAGGCSKAGAIRYNAGDLQWCDGSDWITTDAGNSGAGACTKAGQQRYRSPELEFCNGANWRLTRTTIVSIPFCGGSFDEGTCISNPDCYWDGAVCDVCRCASN